MLSVIKNVDRIVEILKQWGMVRALALGTVVIPVLLLILFRDFIWWGILLFVLWVTAMILLNDWSIRQERQALQKAEQERAIRTLNHHRHDWMNDLQIISGYMQLKRYDKLSFSLDRIKERMLHESKISKLGVPSLVLFFQSFRAECSHIHLDIDIMDDVNLGNIPLKISDDALSECVQGVVQSYVAFGEQDFGEPQHLNICFTLEQQQLCIRFSYEGEVNAVIAWSNKVNSATQGEFIRVEQGHDPATLLIYVPCEA